jgi:hypothetical protein
MVGADFRADAVKESGLGHDSPPCDSILLAAGTERVPGSE